MPNGTSRLEEEYTRGQILGRGASGVAFVVRPKRDPQRQLVAKEMCIVKTDEKRRREALAESQLLRDLSHRNIIVCLDIVQEDDMLYIVMEYANGGDLSRWIQHYRDQERRLPEQTVMSCFVQICAALRYIHSKKILHRDLKPANIFLCGEGDLSELTVKLGDFGIAKMIDGTLGQANSTVGTPSYLSPELCKNNPYGMKADIWSLGVVLYELTCLKVPFHAGNLPAMALMICTSEPKPISEEYSPCLADLVKLLLQKDPAKRPHVAAVLSLLYVQGFVTDAGDSGGAPALAAGASAVPAAATGTSTVLGGQVLGYTGSGGAAGASAATVGQAMPDVQQSLRPSRGTSLPSRAVRTADADAQRLPSCGPGGRPRSEKLTPMQDSNGHWCWQRAGETGASVPSTERRLGETKGHAGPTPRTLNPVVHVPRGDRGERGAAGGRACDRGERPERLEHLEPPRRDPPLGEHCVGTEASDGHERQDSWLGSRGKRPERGARQDRAACGTGRGAGRSSRPLTEDFSHRSLPGLPQTAPSSLPSSFHSVQGALATGDADSEQSDAPFWAEGERVAGEAGGCETPRPEHMQLHEESASLTPENAFAQTDEDLASVLGPHISAAMGATGLLLEAAVAPPTPRRVPQPAETFPEPAPPFADPPTCSVVAALMTTFESQPRVRHRNKRRIPCGRPPLLGGEMDSQDPCSPTKIPQRVGSSSSSTVVGQEPLMHLTAPLPASCSSSAAAANLAARSISPSRTAPLGGELRSAAAELPLLGVLRPSGSAPSLPPLPKILAPKQPPQRSRSLVGLTTSSVGLHDGRDVGKMQGYAAAEAFQPGHRPPSHLCRTAPLPSHIAAEASGGGQSTLPQALASQPPQAVATGGVGRLGTRERERGDEVSSVARLAPKLPTALTSQAVREGWSDARGDCDGHRPLVGRGAEPEARMTTARLTVV